MDATVTSGFLRYFSDLPDPRTGNFTAHKLHDILILSLLAVICGADGWVEIELWGKCKHKWLSTFLDLPGGIPSHDTLGRVFSLLDPDAFERCFLAWMSAVVELSAGRLVAIDGKAIRRSFEHGWQKKSMSHLVSAFVSQGDNHLVFSQLAVEDKDNEIVAIPRLLQLLDLKGAIVTIDAARLSSPKSIGCQREIAAKIVEAGGDYILPVKGNQPTLAAKVQVLMDDLILDHSKNVAGTPVDYFEQSEEGHGRIEKRRVWVSNDIQWLGKDLLDQWPTIGSIGMVERTRQDLSDLSGKVSVERQYYILSLKGLDAPAVSGYVRSHWSIENKLHWQLDISFGEDDSRIRKGHGAENYSRLCRMALNLHKSDKTLKVGVKAKRLYAGWDNDYLLKLINQ